MFSLKLFSTLLKCYYEKIKGKLGPKRIIKTFIGKKTKVEKLVERIKVGE